MADLQQVAADAAAKMQKSNPSNLAGKTPEERKRIPMSLPMMSLEVPEIPGYHLQWLKGDDRVQQALNAGFEFVNRHEVMLNNLAIGGDAMQDGNSDLGSRVSIHAKGGETGRDGQPLRLYLMKQKLEYYAEDQAIQQKRADAVADALTVAFKQGTVGGQAPGETKMDAGLRYVGSRTKVPDLFRRKTNRSQ